MTALLGIKITAALLTNMIAVQAIQEFEAGKRYTLSVLTSIILLE